MSYTSQPYVKIREKLLAGELSVSTIVQSNLNQTPISQTNEKIDVFEEIEKTEWGLKGLSIYQVFNEKIASSADTTMIPYETIV